VLNLKCGIGSGYDLFQHIVTCIYLERLRKITESHGQDS
jgi:hypothetical protein